MANPDRHSVLLSCILSGENTARVLTWLFVVRRMCKLPSSAVSKIFSSLYATIALPFFIPRPVSWSDPSSCMDHFKDGCDNSSAWLDDHGNKRNENDATMNNIDWVAARDNVNNPSTLRRWRWPKLLLDLALLLGGIRWTFMSPNHNWCYFDRLFSFNSSFALLMEYVLFIKFILLFTREDGSLLASINIARINRIMPRFLSKNGQIFGGHTIYFSPLIDSTFGTTFTTTTTTTS